MVAVGRFITEQIAQLVSEIGLGIAVHSVVELETELPFVFLSPPSVHILVVTETDNLFRRGNCSRSG